MRRTPTDCKGTLGGKGGAVPTKKEGKKNPESEKPSVNYWEGRGIMTGEGWAPPGVTPHMFGDCSLFSSRPSVTLRAAGLHGLCQRDLARRNAAHCMLCVESWVCEHTCAPAPFCSAVLAVDLAIPHSRSPGVPTTDGRLVAAFPNFRWHTPLALCAVSAVILATTGTFQG